MKEKIIIVLFGILMSAGGVYLGLINKHELIPTYFLSTITLCFSYYAYMFSKEKFRLELFEKRWEIYQEVLKYSSTVMRHAGLPKHSNDEPRNEEIINALLSAENSFRGLGLHKSKALFGRDIIEVFEKLSKAHAYFVVPPKGDKWIDREDDYLSETWELLENLPNLFKPYVYFGDYKNKS